MADPVAAEPGAPDEYEREYMDAGRAVFRARVRQRLWPRLALMALFAVSVTVVVRQLFVIGPWLWALRHEAPFVVLALFAAYAYFGLTMLWFPVAELIGAVTRVVLTPTHLRVHRGLAATDVPLDAVTEVAVERTRRWFPELPAFGGLSRRDAVYQSFRTKEAVRVAWRDERGKPRRVWVYLDDPEALRERVEALRGGGTGVRVDVADAGTEAAGPGPEDAEEAEAAEVARARRGG